MVPKVEVRGARELRAALKSMDAGLPKEMRSEFLGVATTAAGAVRSKVPVRSGKARASVRPRASQRGASIAAGGAAAPYYPWLDFGGTTGKGHRPGRPWSGSVKRSMPVGGRYLYPTLRGERSGIERAAEAAVVNVARRAGMVVR